MPRHENVSMSVVRRLPRYYRFLSHLRKQGITRISSTELSQQLGLTASQIRQDLNCFGGFGQQGYGYIVSQLCDEIGKILGLSSGYKTVLLGAGNLGRAIANHMAFEADGFKLIGIFDNSPEKIGTMIGGQVVRDIAELETFCKKNKPVMAVFCVPRSAAEELGKVLHQLGVKNYWNFSHYDLSLEYSDAIVENVHLNDSLMTLCYRISTGKTNAQEKKSSTESSSR
jgi:redox-sensing transcriptional repressor